MEPFLQDRYCNDGPSAYGFAEALGLPAYRWLSPLLVEGDTRHFLKYGGRRLGRKKAEKKTRLPEPIELITPKGDLSAQEAMDIVQTHNPLGNSWILYNVSGHAHKEIDHTKLAVLRSDWQFRYLNPQTGEQVFASIFAKENIARVSFRSFGKVPQVYLAQHPQPALPSTWIDSSRVAAIVSGIDPPEEVKQPDGTLFSLWPTPGAVWKVLRGSSRISWNIEVDAITGEVLSETVGWSDEGDYVVKQRRERIRGGAWRDIQGQGSCR